MAQSYSDGEIMNYTTTGAVANGALKIIGRRAGVALQSATGSGQVIALAMTGVHTLPAVATGAKATGSLVGYRTTGTAGLSVSCVAAGCTGVVWSAHPTSGVVTYGTKYVIGTVWQGAATTATTLKVKLHGGPIMPFF
jgi:predicted RecA/RadA family phage recombinase